MTILIRNLEIGNTPVWVLPKSGDWDELKKGIKFGLNLSHEMLLNAAKCQGYGFYSFWVIIGKSTGELKLTLGLK